MSVVLVSEVRGNTDVLERQMQLDRLLNYTDKYLETPLVSDVYAKVKAVDGLEPVAEAYIERYGLTPSEGAIWSRAVQRTLYLWHSDFIFAGPSEELEKELAIIPRYPDVRIAYEINEDGFLSDEFVEYVDSVLANL